MSRVRPAPRQSVEAFTEAIADAVAHGNVEECVTSDGHRFWMFSRTPLAEAKAALRDDILRDAGDRARAPRIDLTPV